MGVGATRRARRIHQPGDRRLTKLSRSLTVDPVKALKPWSVKTILKRDPYSGFVPLGETRGRTSARIGVSFSLIKALCAGYACV